MVETLCNIPRSLRIFQASMAAWNADCGRCVHYVVVLRSLEPVSRTVECGRSVVQWNVARGYAINFRDLGSTEMKDRAMLSSLNFVKSWMTTGFTGHSRRTLAGFVRHCESTNMQSFWLQDAVKCRPCDQLVKTGEEELYLRCSAVLGSPSGLPELAGVDEYRSSMCHQCYAKWMLRRL